MESIHDYIKKNIKLLHNELLCSVRNNLVIIQPQIAIIQIGNNPINQYIINKKIELCQKICIGYHIYIFNENIEEKKIIKLIKKLNNNNKINGISIPLPISKKLNFFKLVELIDPIKDIDGVSSKSLYQSVYQTSFFHYLNNQNIHLNNKNITILGDDLFFTKSIIDYLFNKNCIINILHSNISENALKQYLSKSDIIITNSNHPNILKTEYKYKKTAIILDAGLILSDTNELLSNCEKEFPIKLQTDYKHGFIDLINIESIFNIFLSIKQ